MPKHVTTGPAFDRAGLIHRVRQPDTSGPHPTVVLIQGRLGNEDVPWVFAPTIPKHYLLVAPRAIKAESKDGFSWHMPTGQFPTLDQFDEATAALAHFINALPELYNADLNNLYLLGFSQGAAASIATALNNPDLVKAIACLVGFTPRDVDYLIPYQPLANLPIFMAVGTEDDTIPLDFARNSGEMLTELGADLTYEEYQTGHKLNAAGMRQLKAWWRQRPAS
ncbi:MAG TPA: alpha/beta fold hydrolase [Anaerolineae bacterium]|nr:alpha/beta fold hydrolase [Anaerolineae bacterium]